MFQNVSIFTPKGTFFPESTSFEPFCVKMGRGVRPPGRLGKNSHRDPHRKDVSPLTQSLNYRSACDIPDIYVKKTNQFIQLCNGDKVVKDTKLPKSRF